MINITAIKLNSFMEKAKGLMFQNKIFPVYFETRYGIHTFFVKKPIDIVIMDSKYNVRAIKKKLKPRNIFIWNCKYFRVMELPGGFIDKSRISIGSKINLKFARRT